MKRCSPFWSSFKRSLLVGDVSVKRVDEKVQLSGWLQSIRRVGKGSCFGLLRDHTGVMQLHATGAAADRLLSLTIESALSVSGIVARRPSQNVNPKMASGEVEVVVSDVPFSNKFSVPLPFPIGDASVSEDVRLGHRFLDLRTERLQRNLRARAEVVHAIRSWLRDNGFLEVETPYLFRPTPEGAKEFLVKTRWPSMYYSLPQSPQQYKQLLMMGGADRYFQIARCFRDEDMRSERQPEFTQVDFEMSFSDEEEVMATAESLVNAASQALEPSIGKVVFEKLMYHEALRLYGSDKPDLRITETIESVVAPNISPARFVKRLPIRVPLGSVAPLLSANPALFASTGAGRWMGSVDNGLTEHGRNVLSAGPFLYCASNDEMAACDVLGKVRSTVCPMDPTKQTERRWLWVTHFPMFERLQDGGLKVSCSFCGFSFLFFC
jgi:aspartyl-tRNA synthetase